MKKLLLPSLLLLLSAVPSPAQNPSPLVRLEKMPSQSCRSFVEDFYGWYRKSPHRDLTRRPSGPRWVQALKLKPKSFDASLLQQLQQENATGNGLPIDPILGISQPDNWHRIYANDNVDGYHCNADLLATFDEHSAGSVVVSPELRVVHAHWKFVNFHYRQNDAMPANNLLDILKLRREARLRNEKLQ